MYRMVNEMDKYLEQIDSGLVASKEEEIQRQEEVVKIGEESLEFATKELELVEKVQNIVRNNLKILKPEFEYQTVPEYWEHQKELVKIGHMKELNSKKIELERTKGIVAKEKEKLAKLKGE